MHIHILAIGRLKERGERDIMERYAERVRAAGRQVGIMGLTETELSEAKAQTPAARREDEAHRLLARCPPAAHLVALDEAGATLTSAKFAERLGQWCDDGVSGAVFCLGGPDGHGADLVGRCHLRLSLSAMTLPHGLARVVLAEQLYRAVTILSGHPYHRA
jgi:23S rRNA (pseudouridine1915-N3)-methyltransferase